MVSLASEFPNDNPALHRGVSWVCLDPVGPPVPIRDGVPLVAAEPEPFAPPAPIAIVPPDRRRKPRTEETPQNTGAPVARAEETPPIVEAPVARTEQTSSISGAIEETPQVIEASVARAEETPPIVEAPVAGTEETSSISGAREETPQIIEAPVACAEGSPRIAEESDAPTEQMSASSEMPVPRPEADVSDEHVVIPRASGIVMIDRDDDDEPIVVEELEPLGDVAVEAASEPALDDPWRQLCAVLAAVATGEGAAQVAAALPALLFEKRFDASLGEPAAACLAEGGLLAGDALTDAFLVTAEAWCAVLRGTSDDLSACGGATLDEWAADVLARMLGSAARAPAVRRELRARGVAAFGLLEAA